MAGRTVGCQGGAMAKRDEDKEKRLAEALRENLRRRKAQARDAADKKGDEPKS
jgi:hypothetical protein